MYRIVFMQTPFKNSIPHVVLHVAVGSDPRFTSVMQLSSPDRNYSRVQMTCRFDSGSHSNVKLTWFKGNNKIQSDKNKYKIETTRSETKLTVELTGLDDQDTYICKMFVRRNLRKHLIAQTKEMIYIKSKTVTV